MSRKVQGDAEDLLFTNEFRINPELKDVGREQTESFRRYFEQKRERLIRERIAKQLLEGVEPNDLLNTNEFVSSDPTLNMGFAAHLPPFTQVLGPQAQQQFLSSLPQQQAINRQNQQGQPGQFNTLQNRVTILRKRIVSLDTRDRDTITYPKPNHFKLSLRKTFKNIRSIKLLSTEFPNSDFAFKNTPVSLKNTVLYWQNLEDPISTSTNDRFIYSATINPGNYTATSLASEIAIQLNKIKRNEEISGAALHFFSVSVNLDTDIVSMTSLLFTSLEDNPITTAEGTGVISVSQIAHDFAVGDTVVMQGVKAVAGINATNLNGTFLVDTVPSPNSFTYVINNTANDSVTGGGTSVATGKPDPFKFLFGRFTDTPALPLGFPIEDSSNDISTPDTNQLSVKAKSITNLTVGNPTVITSPSHGFLNGDKVKISGVQTTPPIIDQLFTVQGAIGNSFEIAFETTSVDATTFSDGLLRSNKINVNHQVAGSDIGGGITHGFNPFLPLPSTISVIAQNASGTLDITTTTVHNLETNDTAIIFGTDSTPVIDGSFSSITRLSSTQFRITFAPAFTDQGTPTGTVGLTIATVVDDIVNANTAIVTTSTSHNLQTGNIIEITGCDAIVTGTGQPDVNKNHTITRLTGTTFSIPIAGDITADGATGNINLDRSVVRLYRATELGGIPARFINNIAHTVTKINNTNYTFEVDETEDASFSTSDVTAGGGTLLRVSSNLHGFDGQQDNTSDGSNINQVISLEGENYVFLTSPTIGATMEDSSGTPDIFAKVILSEQPGTLMFNTFITNPRIFDEEGPLRELAEVEIFVKIHNDILYEFNGINFSFTLEIVEMVDVLSNTQISSVRGAQDIDIIGSGIGTGGINTSVGSGIVPTTLSEQGPRQGDSEVGTQQSGSTEEFGFRETA